MNSYEYQENRSKLSEAERVAWLRKNWALQINSLDVLMLCELAAKGLEDILICSRCGEHCELLPIDESKLS